MPRRDANPKPVKAMSWKSVVNCTRAGLAAPGPISVGLHAAMNAAPRRHRPLLQRKLGDLDAANPDDELAHHQAEFNALLSEQPIPENVRAFYIGLMESMDADEMSTALRFYIAGATACDERGGQPIRPADLVWPRAFSYGRLQVFANFYPEDFLSDDPNFGADPPDDDYDDDYEDWASPLQIFATVAAGRLLAELLAAAPRDAVLGPHDKRTCVAGFDAGELFVFADLTRDGVVPRHIRRRLLF